MAILDLHASLAEGEDSSTNLTTIVCSLKVLESQAGETQHLTVATHAENTVVMFFHEEVRVLR